jgi:regulatory protein
MKIIKISKYEKKRNIYIIDLDTGDKIQLQGETLIKFGLRSGDILDEKEILKIKQEDGFISAKASALRLIAKRMRSEKELINRLKIKKYSEDVINLVLENMHKLKLIDDNEFTKKYITDSIYLKRPFGQIAVKQKLYALGINKELINKGVDEYLNTETELDLAYNAAKKKVKFLKKYPKEKQKHRIYSFLAQRGFNYDVVKRVMNKMNFEIEEE